MMIYEFECPSCEHIQEFDIPMSEKEDVIVGTCKKCGETGEFKSIISAPAVFGIDPPRLGSGQRQEIKDTLASVNKIDPLGKKVF